MIELVFGHIDLARVRFAHSPIRELVASLLVLQDPRRQPMYGRWLSTVRPQLGGVRLEVLVALVPAGRILPTFLLPAPTGPRPTLADELAAVAATPPAVVRAELDLVGEGRPLPAPLRAVYEDPAAQLPLAVKELDRYWQVAVEPVWPRMRAVCTADVAHRMERFADGGLARVLASLHLADGDGRVLRGRPAGGDLPPAGRRRAVGRHPGRAHRPAVGAGRQDPSGIAGRPWPAQDDHPAGRPAGPQPTRGQPAPQGTQRHRPGHRPTPRPNGPLPAHPDGDHPTRDHPRPRANRLTHWRRRSPISVGVDSTPKLWPAPPCGVRK